jgi:hypothetical protein
MTWFTAGRFVALIIVAVYIAFIVIASAMGMLGTMFQDFFGSIGSG